MPLDLPALVRFINHAFNDGKNTFLAKDRIDADQISALLLKGYFLLFEEGQQITALIYVEIREKNQGYLGLFAVDPKKRSFSVVRHMTRSGQQFCREHGCRAIQIEVIHFRADLVAHYQRHGYRVVGETPAVHSDHVIGGDYRLILMEKEL